MVLAYEKAVKELILNHKELFTDDPHCSVLFEKNINFYSTIADCLIFTDTEIIGVEIKTAHDTTKRLAKQLKDYNEVCDRVFVLTQDEMVAKVSKVLEGFPMVGLIAYKEVPELNKIFVGTLKLAVVTPINASALLSMLWNSEIRQTSRRIGVYIPSKVRRTKAMVSWVLKNDDPNDVIAGVRETFVKDYLDPNNPKKMYDFKRVI